MLRDSRVRVIGFVGLAALVLWTSLFLTRPQNMEVTFLDVGDGLCTVVRTPAGRTLVMDCGTSSWRENSPTIGSKLVGPYLRRLGVDSIDVAVLSHPHSDHDCGFPGLLKIAPAGLVIDCGVRSKSPEYVAFLKAVKACHARYRTARRGQVIDMGDGVQATIVDPPPGVCYADLNDRSMVLRLTYKGVAVLLTGDASEPAEQEMVKSGMNVHAQVLQVGHHGSRQATSAVWLAAVRPSVAVISCARRSRYHFPSRVVLGRLRSCGARTYVTGQCGAVTVTTDGRTLRVDTVRDLQ